MESFHAKTLGELLFPTFKSIPATLKFKIVAYGAYNLSGRDCHPLLKGYINYSGKRILFKKKM